MSETNLPELLKDAGYAPRLAKAFAWLILNEGKSVTSREIERGADLRQPEAHYAIKIMSERGWIQKIEDPNSVTRPGRPFMLYTFALTREQAFEEIRKTLNARQESLRTTEEKIKKLVLITMEPK